MDRRCVRPFPGAGSRRQSGRRDCRRSSARLSSSTLTAGSPRTPNARPSVLALTKLEHGGGRAGGALSRTRGACSLAFATVICGVESAARRGHCVDRDRHVGRQAVLRPVREHAVGDRVGVAHVAAVLVLLVHRVAGFVGDRVVVLVGGRHGHAIRVTRVRVRIRLAVDRDAGHVADQARVRRPVVRAVAVVRARGVAVGRRAAGGSTPAW